MSALQGGTPNEVSAEDQRGLSPREVRGGRDPGPVSPAPLEGFELDRFELASPLTLDDMTELQRRVRALAGEGVLVEVYSHDGREAIVDVRWPNGARLNRALPIL